MSWLIYAAKLRHLWQTAKRRGHKKNGRTQVNGRGICREVVSENANSSKSGEVSCEVGAEDASGADEVARVVTAVGESLICYALLCGSVDESA